VPYLFKGRLCGLICPDCPEPLSGLKVRLYASRAKNEVTALAVAHPKETFAILDDKAANEKSRSLIAEIETDAEGRFELQLGEDQRYTGDTFEVDLYCGTVPHLKPGPRPPQPLQISITTLQPLWREIGHDRVAVWDYCIPHRLWCSVRARFGAWTICGRLTTCREGTPIAGATVSAFDADWLQDDPLGSPATTDLDGKFRIDYTTADFRRTPWSPSINIEWISGPDLYFKAEYGGVEILNEPRTIARTPARENVGPCFCVELCTDKLPVPEPTGPEKTPHWQKVDDFNIHPFAPNPASAFSLEGYAGGPANAYVLGGGVPLRGNCPLRNAANPANALQYRFRIGEWTWPGGGDGDASAMPTVAPGSLNPVRQIHPSEVGWVFYNDGVNPFASASVVVTSADMDADGWIKVDGKIVTVPMDDGTTTTVTVTPANFLRTDLLVNLNSEAVTAAHPERLPGGLPKADAGRSLTLAEQEPIRRYRLQFQVRDSVSHALVAVDTLSAVILDNSDVRLALDLEELRTNACNPVSTAIHILYTVDHPHLASFSLGISNNNGGIHPPPPLPAGAFAPGGFFFRGGAGGPHQVANDGGFAVDVSGDPPCAYRVVLRWQTRRYHDPGHSTDILYCK
jgi:hypothetical protein